MKGTLPVTDERDILITRDREFKAEKAVSTSPITFSLLYHPKSRSLCLVNSSKCIVSLFKR